MVAALVHSTQIPEPGDRIEEMKKQNINLIKKLKKEMADRDSDSIKPLRQLLPFSKHVTEIVVCQSNTLIIDSKGNKVASLEFVDKKQVCDTTYEQCVLCLLNSLILRMFICMNHFVIIGFESMGKTTGQFLGTT